MSLDGGVSDGTPGGVSGKSKDGFADESLRDGSFVEEDGGVEEFSPKYFLPGEGETLRGPLIKERRNAYLAVMELCPAAILIPLQDCPRIAEGTCSAVAQVMSKVSESTDSVAGTDLNIDTGKTAHKEAVTAFSDTPCLDAEKRQADYAALKAWENPPIPWTFDSFKG